MNKHVYVGNLPLTFKDSELKSLFENYGNVVSADVFNYSGSERFGKYGFVEMGSEVEASCAILGLNNIFFTGRRITVAYMIDR